MRRPWLFLAICCFPGHVPRAATFAAPAGSRPTHRHERAAILPGGRIIAPLGEQFLTGAGSFGLAVAANARFVLTANSGPGRNSLSLLERDRGGAWRMNHFPAGGADRYPQIDLAGVIDREDTSSWRGVFMGAAIAGEHSAWVSEGNSGKVSLFDWSNESRRSIDLNTAGASDSYTGDLAYDRSRNLLYVIDQANFRVAVVDTRSRQVIASIKTGRLPFALALSPEGRKLFITNAGSFEYRALPGADPARSAATGLPFPAFGFPSAEAVAGATRSTAQGRVQVPGLGEPNVREANSLEVVDVSTPAAPKLVTFIPAGRPIGAGSIGGSSPSGIAAAGTRVFVANTNQDSITVIDSATNSVTGEIPIRIPGLDQLRGVLPIGLAWDEKNGRLLVAEAGINAIGIIDPAAGQVVGHIPTACFPTRLALADGIVFVANARGWTQGPNYPGGAQHQGSLSVFPLPTVAELAAHSRYVLESNGFVSHAAPEQPVPPDIRHIVLIVKENRTYDEVFGDLDHAAGAPSLARFGMRGYVDGERARISIRDVPVTPNHHALASRWAIGDNFYADGDVAVDGHHWLVGAPPNAWIESSLSAAYSDQNKDFRLGSAPGRLLFAGAAAGIHPEDIPEGGTLWHHLESHGIPFRNFGEGLQLAGVEKGPGLEPTGARFLTNMPMPDPLYRNTSRQYPGLNMNISDQFRADQFIAEIRQTYIEGGGDLPRLLVVHLPNDYMDRPRPAEGYPYRASYVADNDLALGRIVEFLSGTKWWPNMAIFVTEASAQGGIDHIDSHRTILMAIGPWIKRGYVTHRNSSFPGLLKTIFRLLGIPPLNLFDASATGLDDIFASALDPAPYRAVPVDRRLYDPAGVRPR